MFIRWNCAYTQVCFARSCGYLSIRDAGHFFVCSLFSLRQTSLSPGKITTGNYVTVSF